MDQRMSKLAIVFIMVACGTAGADPQKDEAKAR
jgi:hypothetical protein